MKAPSKLRFRNAKEEHAVRWFKASHGRRWLKRALSEVAYEERPASIPRDRWVAWNARPYGHQSFNEMHQWARLCIRRNVYLRDVAT